MLSLSLSLSLSLCILVCLQPEDSLVSSLQHMGREAAANGFITRKPKQNRREREQIENCMLVDDVFERKREVQWTASVHANHANSSPQKDYVNTNLDEWYFKSTRY